MTSLKIDGAPETPYVYHPWCVFTVRHFLILCAILSACDESN